MVVAKKKKGKKLELTLSIQLQLQWKRRCLAAIKAPSDPCLHQNLHHLQLQLQSISSAIFFTIFLTRPAELITLILESTFLTGIISLLQDIIMKILSVFLCSTVMGLAVHAQISITSIHFPPRAKELETTPLIGITAMNYHNISSILTSLLEAYQRITAFKNELVCYI